MPSKKKSSTPATSTALARVRRHSDASDEEDTSKALVLRTPQQIRQEEGGSFSKALVRRAQTGQGGALVSGRGLKIVGGMDRLKAMDEYLSKQMVRAPFNLEQLRKIADSQLDAHMDDIDNLHRVDFFYDDILMHIKARAESLPDANGRKRDMLRDEDFVARVIGTRIHYAFLSAASWRLIREYIQDLEDVGVTDSTVKSKIHQSPPIREQYMRLYDLTERVADMERKRLGRVAAASEHFSKYFTKQVTKEGEQIVFKKEMMKSVFTDLVDLIIVKLALPDALPDKSDQRKKAAQPDDEDYSLYQLYALLHEAFADSPKEEKKLSQQLNDAIGDLSTVVQLLDMLDVPLSTADGKRWKTLDPLLTPEFEEYLNCQDVSRAALSNVATFGRFVWPLEKTKDKKMLESMWAALDKNVILEDSHSGKRSLEELWDLEEARQPVPQWTYTLNVSYDDKDGDAATKQIADRPTEYDAYQLAMVPTARARKPKDQNGKDGKKKQLRISNKPHDDDDDGPPPLTSGTEDEDDDGLPDLLSMSDSSADDDDYEDTSDEEEDDDEFLDEKALDEFYREAMDPDSDLFDSMPDYVSEPEDTKPKVGPAPPPKKVVNPLKKLLAALTGRNFSADAAPSTQQRASRPYFHRPEKAPTGRTTLSGDPELPDLIPYVKPRRPGAPAPAAPPGKKANVVIEEEEDIEAGGVKQKKKKKKPKKKKTAGDSESIISPATPEPAPSPQLQPEAVKSTTPTTTPQKQAPKATSNRSEIDLSRIPSLPVSETSAQSGQSYLRTAGADVKTKIKTRGEAVIPEERGKKPNLWSRILPKKDEKKEEEDAGKKKEGGGVFGAVKRFTVKRKIADIMRQILQSADEDEDIKATKVKPLKWEDFLKGMQGMGFEVDLTTAGSSVRFDPPNKNDRPISFHKPHPDPTVQPMMLKSFARRLKRHYGWMDENFRPWKD